MIPLLNRTRQPIAWSTFSFGGDDYLAYTENFLSKDDPLRKEMAAIELE